MLFLATRRTRNSCCKGEKNLPYWQFVISKIPQEMMRQNKWRRGMKRLEGSTVQFVNCSGKFSNLLLLKFRCSKDWKMQRRYQIFVDSSKESEFLSPRICQAVGARNEYGCGSSQELWESAAFLNEPFWRVRKEKVTGKNIVESAHLIHQATQISCCVPEITSLGSSACPTSSQLVISCDFDVKRKIEVVDVDPRKYQQTKINAHLL